MRAIAYRSPGPISAADALIDIDLPEPVPQGRDLLVEIKAISVNPVDTKIRAAAPVTGKPRVLGFDAAGVVRAVGPEASLFKPGDTVYYAGAVDRPGSNAELQLVDERIVGRKPTSLDFAGAAALPLTTITAYEALFHRLRILDPVPGAADAILITAGAGGVGSIAIPLVKQLTGLAVITTASRPDSVAWVEALGADHVLDHRQPLATQVEALGIGAPPFVFSISGTLQHAAAYADLIAPQGRLAMIDDFGPGFDIALFKRKAVSLHWEMMFARSVFHTADMIEQHHLLNHVADLVDAGRLKTTKSLNLGTINAQNLIRAHAAIEAGGVTGKIVLEGF
jgi:zinc-binding alcohol dehydrogenase family protein